MRIVIALFALSVGLLTSNLHAAQITVFSKGAPWRYILGTQEASSPMSAWRQLSFNDSTWTNNAPTPIGYGEPALGTQLPGPAQANNYLSVYLRKTFSVADVSRISRLDVQTTIDDGFVMWINGTEVGRFNVNAGELAYNGNAIAANEPTDVTISVTTALQSLLVPGNNVIAVHMFNANVTSSDLFFDASLTVTEDTEAPTLAEIFPRAGSTNRELTEIELTFSEPVQGVDASDLLINGVAATEIEFGQPGSVVFRFPQPATGVVQVAFAAAHGIRDLAPVPNSFAGGSWSYTLDPNLPVTALIITEFMADNKDTYNDEDGDASDWIEIHNPGTATMDLSGWFLTDAAGNLTKWRFPNGVSLSAGGYMVVFASSKNRTNPAGRLHTNFQLSSGGEYLALVDPNTNIVSEFSPTYPVQSEDVSYGRDTGDPTIAGYFLIPTPGRRNEPSGPGFAPKVEFSRHSGTFVLGSPFQLVLSTPSPTATIYYTTTTNVPGTSSTRYTAPIDVANTVIVRARAFEPGKLPGPITTMAYVALTNRPGLLNFNSHLPVIIMHNYGQGVFPTSKPDHYVIVQAFEPGTTPSSMTNPPSVAAQGVSHVRGSSTAVDSNNKASFLIEFQDEFRDDREIEFLGLPEESDFILYAPNQYDLVMIKNPLAHALARDLGEYASRTRFVELYLHDDAGVPGAISEADYWGIYVLEERIKRDNNRVDIAPLEPEHVNEPEVTGGYLLSIDRPNNEPQISAGGATLNVIDPGGRELTNIVRRPQRDYIINYMNTFNSTLNNNTIWTNPVTGYAAYIDVDSWVRRHIHEVITHNIDALRLSGYFFKDRNKKIEYGPAWDYDRTMGAAPADNRSFNPRTWRSPSGDQGTDYFNFLPWWGRLFQAPDFWQRWIDKYQEYRLAQFSLANISNHVERLGADVRPAFARDVTRWGRAARSGSISADGFTHNFGSSGYDNELNWLNVWYSNRLHFIDTQFLARPHIGSPAGQVSTGATVTISQLAKPGSTLFYTLDGSDPRLSGGAINPLAYSSTEPVTINVTTNVRVFARSWNADHRNLTGVSRPPISSPWSGPSEGTFYTHLPPLRITEIMYHPHDPPANYTNDGMFEYIEVKNIGTAPLNINRFTLSGGVDFPFPNELLAAGESAVIVASIPEFQARYGTSRRILGQYGGVHFGSLSNQLDNAGERLVLRGPVREPILDFSYDDEWYPITDGFGFSLVIVNDQAPVDTWGLKASWRPSGALGGSPSQNDPAQPNFPLVVINEVLTHSDPPPPTDTIELHNLGTAAGNIGGWWLTDDFRDPKKYRIPDDTTIAGGGFLLFNESNFNQGQRAFALSSLGQEVYLFSADAVGELTGYVHGFDFGAAENGRTFGRYVISTGTAQYPAQASATLGGANAGPLIGPIVITEIHYRPPDLPYGGRTIDNDLDEYIELHNISSEPVGLYHPTFPTNTWRLTDAVDYQFPQGTVVPAGGYLLIVGFNPTNASQLATFRARNSVSPDVAIFGPWEGKLDNSGEAVELRRPDRPEPAGPPNFGLVPYLLVERVRYSDEPPWPLAADGIGPSLQRRVAGAYGNDPANWVAAATSPGAGYGGGTPPTITAHPQNTTVVGYNDTMLSVTAEGPNLRYQWLFEGSILPGATNSVLALTNVLPAQEGNYVALVMNPAASLSSSNAFLDVLIPANIISHPQSREVRPGASVLFTVVAESSSEISYQWFKDGTAISGATEPNYSIPSADVIHRGVYRVQVTDDVGSRFSDSAVLTVLIDPIIVQQPLAQTVPRGGSATFSVAITNTANLPIEYRWRVQSRNILTNVLNRYIDFFTVSNVVAVSNVAVGVINIARPGGVLSSLAALTPVADFDNDGMPDSWEVVYGFDTNNAGDALLDFDGDTAKNRHEYIAGTNPTNELSYFLVELVNVAPDVSNAVLRYGAVSNRTYSVQYQDGVGGGWLPLYHGVARSTNHTVEVTDTSPQSATRFYQLVTPQKE